jgi:hypothetical protein
MYSGPEVPKRREGFSVKFGTGYNLPTTARAPTGLPHNTADKFSNRSNLLEVAQGGMLHKYAQPSLERFAKYVMSRFRDV